MKVKIVSKVQKALQRQIKEAVRIMEDVPAEIMNSKSGFGNNKIPRISITMGDDTKLRRKDSKRRDDDSEDKTGTQAKDSNSDEVEVIPVHKLAETEEKGGDRGWANGPKAPKKAKKRFVDPHSLKSRIG